MIVLIAESKMMASPSTIPTQEEFSGHQPPLLSIADKTIHYLRSIDSSELSIRLGISNQLAVKAIKLIYDYQNPESGRAIDLFKGEVFKALDYDSLSQEGKSLINERLRIISSLYGILRPDDYIKPYRLEFNKDCAPDGLNMIKYLKPKVTIAFVNFLKNSGEKEVLDLLPKDASDCLDWKIIKAFAKVMKINFKVYSGPSELKTPVAGRLKELRGKMLREILEKNINSFKDLLLNESDHFAYDPENSKQDYPTFIA